MLEYFYSGEIDEKTLETHSKDLFAIAHKYQVKQLMDICEDYMISTIAAENFSKDCLFAELYHLSKLKKVDYFILWQLRTEFSGYFVEYNCLS
ncbi:unnamed protein product [Meloidogyne enterolobii]|uniref:Uncharacterized protein n=1 Tax=Meloidogyne enterolobii TaxID=390850 RepID=A0ACB0ZGC0_MELEN